MEGLFNAADYPDLLVGLDSPDDAAVWKIDDARALVVTTDFFTPVVDDAFDYGAIAATNSLSDIYAMGGLPVLALNIAALPPQLPASLLSEILRGGATKVKEAGAVIAGGHTIQDKEPKYGLVAVGFVDPAHMLTKAGAQPGDVLVLTKPLGMGVTTTALKREMASADDVTEAVSWMKWLNRGGRDLALACGVRAATDITGFALAGHGLEMADASKVGFQVEFNRLPFLSHARDYARQWTFPGGASDNRLFYGSQVHFEATLDEADEMLVFDPQTSGGLLMAVPAGQLDKMTQLAQTMGQPIWSIGEVVAGSGLHIV
jgi:selenide,water dikinase